MIYGLGAARGGSIGVRCTPTLGLGYRKSTSRGMIDVSKRHVVLPLSMHNRYSLAATVGGVMRALGYRDEDRKVVHDTMEQLESYEQVVEFAESVTRSIGCPIRLDPSRRGSHPQP